MRIISGKWKGRRFDLPKGVAARPTSDKIREAVFSILGDRVPGAHVLDLFCGSGAIGLEALSRGAAGAVFCDADKRCIARIRETLRAFGQPDTGCRLMACDFRSALSRLKADGGSFDIIYIDPPYKGGCYNEALEGLREIADSRAVILAEHDRRDRMPDEAGGFQKTGERLYGDTVISFYGRIS